MYQLILLTSTTKIVQLLLSVFCCRLLPEVGLGSVQSVWLQSSCSSSLQGRWGTGGGIGFPLLESPLQTRRLLLPLQAPSPHRVGSTETGAGVLGMCAVVGKSLLSGLRFLTCPVQALHWSCCSQKALPGPVLPQLGTPPICWASMGSVWLWDWLGRGRQRSGRLLCVWAATSLILLCKEEQQCHRSETAAKCARSTAEEGLPASGSHRPCTTLIVVPTPKRVLGVETDPWLLLPSHLTLSSSPLDTQWAASQITLHTPPSPFSPSKTYPEGLFIQEGKANFHVGDLDSIRESEEVGLLGSPVVESNCKDL